VQGYESPCDVVWRVGRGVLGACRPFLDPRGIGRIRAIPPLRAPAFRAGQVPTDVRDLVVGTRAGEGLVTTGGSALGPGRCLDKLRCACAARVLRSVRCVLDVLAHAIACVRIPPGVAEGKPVRAAHLERRAPVYKGAGVGVASKAWRREHALDAQERAAMQWCTPSRVDGRGSP